MSLSVLIGMSPTCSARRMSGFWRNILYALLPAGSVLVRVVRCVAFSVSPYSVHFVGSKFLVYCFRYGGFSEDAQSFVRCPVSFSHRRFIAIRVRSVDLGEDGVLVARSVQATSRMTSSLRSSRASSVAFIRVACVHPHSMVQASQKTLRR
uniref:Putative secreted protein n=1 Tax=Amblyomma triste TaxID=251400 RepID=A0A023G2N8_AMBTT